MTENNYKIICKNFCSNLSKINQHYSKFGSYLTGEKENLKFYLNENKLRCRGSLTKFHSGNNLVNLSFSENCEAINRLEHIFNYSFDEAIFYRIDTAFNLNMDNPVSFYLKLLCTPKGFKQMTVSNETKEFRTKSNSLVFYDKGKEILKDKSLVTFNKTEYILRYERRFMSRVRTHFGKNLTVRDLKSPEIYNKLLQIWYSDYENLSKITISAPEVFSLKNLTQFNNWLKVIGLKTIGADKVLDIIKEYPTDRNAKFKMRKSIQKLLMISSMSPILKDELDFKIYEIYELAQAS